MTGVQTCALPISKQVLNDLHVRRMQQAAADAGRGTARDVLTLFDEDGLVVACAEPSLAALLQDFRWRELFWAQRQAVVAKMCFHVFGHALADKLRAPFRGLTAKALILPVSSDELALPLFEQVGLLDRRLAARLREPQTLASTHVLSPLPVLGIPGWWPRQDEAFYLDQTVFRPKRPAKELT